MSQANPVIGANPSGLAYRTADNDAKKALLNHHKGSTAPSYREAGMIWLDDTATPWVLKIYDGNDWILLGDVNATSNLFTPYAGSGPAAGTALANTFGAAQVIDGATDAIQLRVQGHTTQTSDLIVAEKSDGTDVFNLDNAGNAVMAGTAKATGYRTHSLSIADDAVHSFTPPFTSGFVLVHTNNGAATKRVMAQYCTSGTAVMSAISIGTDYNAATGALTGTTGTDSKVTVSAHTDGKIYIENRSGAAATLNYSILG